MNENTLCAVLIIASFIVIGLGMFVYSVYDTYMKEITKRKAIEALKSNVELKISSADIKEFFK